MKTILASIVTTVLIVAMTLVAMFALVRATEYVTSLESPFRRAAAMAAEIVLGIVLLLGTVWLATHLAVRIFTTKEQSSMAAPGVAPDTTPSGRSGSPSSGGPVV